MKRIELIGSAFRREALLGPSTRALIPRGIWVALLAMVLVGIALWSTPASADGEEAGEPVWSADMTVVEYTSVSIGAASADLFSNVGGSGNLQIKSLWSHVPDRDLRLAFADEVPNAADYTLQVGDLSLEFPADSSGASSFKWHDVDVDWEDGQLVRVRIVLTSEIAAPQVNSPATGVPTVRGTAQVGETLAADTSGIADEDGLDSVSYHYQWMRTEAHIADATDSTYTLTDDDQGKTIRLKVSFIDDNGNSETLTSAATAEVSKRPQFLVSNLGVGVEGAGGIQRTLNAARSGFAQAFTTGAKTNGYVVGSVDIQMTQFFDASNTADQLRVTINGAASEGEPGDAHCTLTNPSSFTALSVITFEAPTGAGSCPQLAAETTYFVVIEWTSPTGTDSFAVIPQTYPTKESAAIAEDPGGAEGWSIADQAYYLSVISNARTWTEYDEMASFKIKVKEGAAIAAKANSPATGVPTITGTVQVGETLTADMSEIADEDGIDDVEFSYQWLADDTDIDGATSSTYTMTDADQGKIIKVTVSFADDAENEETLTSAATAAVAAAPNREATGAPTITGTPQVGETLTADTSAIEDEDGLENVSYEYQWIRSDNGADTDIAGATDSTYTLVLADLGKTIKVQVTFTDDRDNQESLLSEATVAATATVPSAPQSLTVTRGSQTQELDVSWQAPSSNGGSDVTGYKVQWKEVASSWDTAADVSEATETGTTHTITSLTGEVEYAVRVIATNDVGDSPASTETRATPADSSAAWTATLTVGVSGSGSETVWGYSWFLDGMGTLDKRTYNEGDQTIEVMAILLSNGFVAFNVRPHPGVDFVLTVDGTEFASADASEVKSRTLISYVWATTLDWAEDDRVALSLTLKDTDSAEQSEPEENTPATGLPTISGTVQAGQTLTADTSPIDDQDGLEDVSYSYQWIRSDGNNDTDIPDATDTTYTLTVDDVGKAIQVRVTFTDDAENEETLTSVATEAVSAKPNSEATGLPTISGTPQVDQTLTADTSGISDEDGLDDVEFSYQWIANDGNSDTDIDDATDSTYTPSDSDVGKTIKVRVTFTDDADNEETLTSEATAEVTAAPVPLTVSVTVSAPASHDGSSEFTFEIEFSEEFGLSYRTMKFDAFNVTGGSVERAQRTDKPSNIPWRITIKPQGNGDVTIVLPVTTDCNADGAICTGDGRKLSNSLSFTVSGPGG